ncbi:MAG: asparagine synthase (glutamine-hydrolyzing) [Candidatus Sungbacteria bacterium]|nr:asparagine synthase (glutamine-hydrolyzing) [Candidatus Sungbacteria bacterium]
MCGIIALAGKKIADISPNRIDAMLDSLARRGPDDRGVLSFPSCVLGQTRLSILDLSGGHQPMRDNQKNIAVTFNGEIYNYRELKKDLERKGHVFSTKSDTEAILKCYREYGADCPKYLDGMFAFIVWDDEKQMLFAARDRFGKKPLYYGFDGHGTLFMASEIKALARAGIRGVIDPEAIDNYLTLMYIPPWKSVYANIHVIPPAYSASFKIGWNTPAFSRYWRLESNPLSVSYADAKKEIKRLFLDSVRKRMIADVEIGALLSGGVDSTLVCAYAQKFSRHPLKTFTVGYEHYINELPYAREASETIGTDHYTLQATSDLTHELTSVIGYMDEPHADSSNFPQHLVSRLAASKVKVALSGDGADELFMGYGWYWKYRNVRKVTQIKNALISNPFQEHLKLISVFQPHERRKLWKNPDAVNGDIVGEQAEACKKNNTQKINLFDLTAYLPGRLLTKVDRTSMMHSLEVRCPFLDYRLAEYVYNLPEKYKMDGASGKIILKDMLREIMPEEFVYRRKQGFGAPVSDWLKTDAMKKLVHEKLGGAAMIYEFLNKEAVTDYLRDFYSRDHVKTHYKIWVLLCLELWLETRQ